jgi:hypothetical protein
MNDFGKRLLGRIDTMYRYLVLNYQFGVVGKAIERLDREDRRQLLELVNRRTQAAGPDPNISAEAFTRLRSDNSQLRMHALANWIGAVYVETRDSADGDLQDLHRRVLKTLRTLREETPTRSAPRAA